MAIDLQLDNDGLCRLALLRTVSVLELSRLHAATPGQNKVQSTGTVFALLRLLLTYLLCATHVHMYT